MQRPNILVFMTDDHGQWASGCYGNRELHTPSLDHLAATGVRMSQAFTPSPVCSPARASFFTGHIPSSHGIHDWLRESERAGTHLGLGDQSILATTLADLGYETGLVGKWHCGHSSPKPPGFDYWYCLADGTDARFGRQNFSDNGRTVHRHGYQGHMLTDAALQFLRESRDDRPFFLFVGYTDTHSPFAGEPPRLVDLYRGCQFDDIPDETFSAAHGQAFVPRPKSADEHREQLAQYYAAVSLIDEQVGRIMDELANFDQLGNTLIVYTADHGHMNGHHGLYCKGNATTPQNFLDESIRVPCIWSWRGGLPSRRVADDFVDHCDLHATLLQVAGMDRNEARTNGPGRSYLPILRGVPVADWRDVQYGEYGNARMIRTRSAKLIRRYPGPNGSFPDEFYDLTADPRERHNVINHDPHQTLIQQMSQRLDAYFARYEDPQYSGTYIVDQPICNADEPWRRM